MERRLGQVHAGHSTGNVFDGNTYHMPRCTANRWKWHDTAFISVPFVAVTPSLIYTDSVINTRTGWGPQPPAPEPSADLSRPRSAVLSAVEQLSPATLADLADETGLHVNTVREHLDGLLQAGLVRREAAAPTGRGRPAWLYRSVPRMGGAVTEYAGLATALAAVIHRTSSDPTADAEKAGEDWGRELANAAGRPETGDPAGRRRQVTKIFETMGFEPDADDEHVEVRLTRCPLLDAALQHPDIVCGVHLGTARGALETYGLDGSRADLLPFAEPGACVLLLDTGAEGER